MKANELMIGDWVEYLDEYHIITKINKAGRSVGLWGKFIHDDIIIPTNNIKPIPLTLEILKKNSFVCIQKDNEDEYEYECWQFSEGLITIDYEPEVKWLNAHNGGENGNAVRTIDYYTDGDVMYVHELQHLLRMCHIKKDIEL